MWKIEKLTLTKQIFRQITYLVLFSLVKTLLWRNFCHSLLSKWCRNVKSWFHEIFVQKTCQKKFVIFKFKLWYAHTVEFTKFLYHLKIISWNQLYSKLFTEEIVFMEIFQKVVIQKFRKRHSVRSVNNFLCNFHGFFFV